MKKWYILLTILIFNNPLTAQHKYDYNWMMGYSLSPGYFDTLYGGSQLNFNKNPVELKRFDIYQDKWATSDMSDADGNLIFYSNGCTIANRNHQLMKNGDDINVGGRYFDYYCLGITYGGEVSGYPGDQGIMALPWPGKSDRYALFHLHSPEDTPYRYPFRRFLFTEIDMKGDSGLGEVTRKNQVIVEQDSFLTTLTAVRHANGRDWWLVLPKENSTLFYVFLFSPEGISAPVKQSIGMPIEVRMFQAVFSPNGKKYACISGLGILQVFDFDRCTGLFSNPNPLVLPESNWAKGVAFSPNSRYLYLTINPNLYQYDFKALDWRVTKTFIDKYDGFYEILPTNFYQMMLAPDGKIYMTTPNGTRFMHVIHNPNGGGHECLFEQRGLEMPTNHAFSPPNFPHFRLFDIPGSPCDTLGINGLQPPEDTLVPPRECTGRWRLYPNPTPDFVQLEASLCADASLRIFDVVGRLLVERSISADEALTPIDLRAYDAGMYFLQLRFDDGREEVQGVAVLR